ncbi:sulfite exporter TauE/SafE family protein [Simiduia agarivorans]|uniref:Probable membrane transporter protein n=1 Tax=Simiduia agarivorans (strain DSM 21679 / JCM 13881 / BCRC 17597 / SA1) TaxID=1117647 RepID=K4KTI1_SIMAS|nr:sulfite exporter TauE/SafE family protein [Simiduia agarivorans]AFU97267.1 permease [Simiduia agarivorans SA1 = DSM 21679]
MTPFFPELSVIAHLLIALVFIWSGFVRSGLGFGGAVLSLPFILLIDDRPLVYLPIIAVHLLVFSSLSIWGDRRKHKDSGVDTRVDWGYLKRALGIMLVPKLIGVFGLLALPNHIMTGIIFAIVVIYSISYIANRPIVSKQPWMDTALLMLGGYVSGTSLIGAPLIVAVFAAHVAQARLRNTLFALWFILVAIKMAAFIWADVDLQLIQHLWLLPCAAVGHWLGQRLHNYLAQTDARVFYRWLGAVLLLVSSAGLTSIMLA